MTVAELIELLKAQPQDLQVIVECCSDYDLLEDIGIITCCEPRPDGYVQRQRKDKPSQDYLRL